jgi:hypothetical protein
MKAHAIRSRLAPLAAALAIAGLSALAAPAAADLIPLAREGDPSPDGNGTLGAYLSYAFPCVNDGGQVAFTTRLNGTTGGSLDNDVLVRAEPGEPLVILAREGDLIPSADGLYGALHNTIVRQHALANGGRVAFVAPLTATPGGTTDNLALYSSDGPGTTSEHARRGDDAPGTTFTFNGLFPPQVNNESPLSIAYYASLGMGTMPSTIYVSRTTTATLMAYLGQAAPNGNGTLFRFFDSEPPAIKTNDQTVAFWAHLTGTVNGSIDDDGIFMSRGAGLIQVARGGQPAPGGGVYQEFTGPVIDILGNTAFQSNLQPVPSGGEGIYIAGAGSDDRAVITGTPLPDHTGTFASLYWPALSAGNVAAFKANLSGTPGGGFDDSGIYRGDGTILWQVAREDQTVPEGGGKFGAFDNVVAINAAAHIAFVSTLRGTPGGGADNRGLYIWDEINGLCKLLRKGEVISGRTVVDFQTISSRDYGGNRFLNDAHQVVVRIDFSGMGGDGIYLASCGATTAIEPAEAPVAVAFEVGPNPFRGGPLNLRYALPGPPAPVRITVHDAAGRQVRTLASTSGAAGNLTWDGAGETGRRLARGVYYLRLESKGAEAVRRVVWLGP